MTRAEALSRALRYSAPLDDDDDDDGSADDASGAGDDGEDKDDEGDAAAADGDGDGAGGGGGGTGPRAAALAAAAARLTAPDALPPLLPALRELLEGPLAADGGGRFPRDAPLREYLQFAEPDLEDAPWFAASFPPALELRHALETYRFLVARAAPS